MRLMPALMLGTALLTTPALAAELPPIRTITVTGQAERKVVPDEAHIRVNLNAQDKQLATAKAEHDKKIAKLMAIVKDAGIDEKQVRTESSGIQPVYHYDNVANGSNKRVFDGYRVQSSLDITVSDTSKLSGLMESITTAGFEQGANAEWGDLLNMYYTLSAPNALRDELVAQAIDNAKDKADKMAYAAGAMVGDVYQISEGNVASFTPQPMMMASAMAKASVAAIAPPAGEQEVQSSVTITYELK